MNMNLAVVSLILLFCLDLPIAAQGGAAPVARQVRAYREAHEKQIVTEFVSLLSIPNHAGDRGDIERNAQEISAMLRQRGVQVDRKSTRLNSSHVEISYAVFCLKKKKKQNNTNHIVNNRH